MLRAGVDGLEAGAAEAGFDRPVALGVTVLTSDPDASAFPSRLEAAVAGGCGGVVCSVRELPVVKDRSRLLAVVPGIRLPGGATHDQARVGTPAEAIAAGADLLVIGRRRHRGVRPRGRRRHPQRRTPPTSVTRKPLRQADFP